MLGVARLWRDVRLYQPDVARGKIDWDKALVDSLPALRSAATPEEFQAALDRLVAPLHDPAVQGASAAPVPHLALAPATPAVEWLRGDIALLHADDEAALEGLARRGNEIAQRAKGVIIDLRPASDAPPARSADELVSHFIDKPVSLPGFRYAVHAGYTPQRGTTSGNYNSQFINLAASILRPSASARAIPIVFVLGSEAAPPLSALALQHSGKAWIVSEGPVTLARMLPSRVVQVDPAHAVRFTSGELSFEDGSGAAKADREIAADPRSAPDSPAVLAALDMLHKVPAAQQGAAAAPAEFRLVESPYAGMRFPDQAWRQLAVVKLWAVMDAFFPYKAHMDRPWDEALPLYLKRMETVSNAQEYGLAIAEMATWLQDSHVRTLSTDVALWLGPVGPGITLERIGGKIAVTAIASPELPGRNVLKVGDVVVAVDGEDAEQRLARLESAIAGSTQSYRDHTGLFYLPRGPNGTTATLRVIGPDGALREVALARKIDWRMPEKTDPVFRMLDGNIGYADLTRLQPSEVARMFEALKNTAALVLDMRGYPRGVFYELARHINVKGPGTAANISRPGHSPVAGTADHYDFGQALPPALPAPYRGRLVMLINEQAISQSEHTALFVEAAAPVTFVGTHTAGADGDITNTLLPGDIQVKFSGQGVRHADGRQLQRVGIQPDIKVAPTIAGIRAGRDEVLERALAFIKTGSGIGAGKSEVATQ
jgi:C-terminal processing protease CtpA/Prc